MISNIGVVKLHLSDHKTAFCFLNRIRSHANSHYRITERSYIRYRKFKKVNKEQFIRDLLAVPWSLVSAFSDTDDKVHAFFYLFIDVWNAHAPIFSQRVRKQPASWMS